MTLLDRLDPLLARMARLPDWARSGLAGALFIWLLFGLRGGLIALPIISLLVLFTSQDPAADFGKIGLVLGVMTVGGFMSGLSHSLFSRQLRRLPLGRYIAGWVTAIPYMFVVVLLLRLVERRPLPARFEAAELFAVIFCVLIFGSMLGHYLYGEAGE